MTAPIITPDYLRDVAVEGTWNEASKALAAAADRLEELNRSEADLALENVSLAAKARLIDDVPRTTEAGRDLTARATRARVTAC